MEPSCLSIVTRDSPPCDLAPSRGKQPRAIKLRVIPQDDRFLRNARKPRLTLFARYHKNQPKLYFPVRRIRTIFPRNEGINEEIVYS